MLSEQLGDRDHLRRYAEFTEDLVELVLAQHGTLKAEHGTGRIMAPYVRRQFGDELYEIMIEIKRLCDPRSVLNPGILINDDPNAHLAHLKTAPEVEEEVDRCVECGYCEPVCPSRDLTLTPRQRIVLRREQARAEAAGDHELVAELQREYDYDGLDTCAADGMCATACPVLIDTGQLVKRLAGRAGTGAGSNRVAGRRARLGRRQPTRRLRPVRGPPGSRRCGHPGQPTGPGPARHRHRAALAARPARRRPVPAPVPDPGAGGRLSPGLHSDPVRSRAWLRRRRRDRRLRGPAHPVHPGRRGDRRPRRHRRRLLRDPVEVEGLPGRPRRHARPGPADRPGGLRHRPAAGDQRRLVVFRGLPDAARRRRGRGPRRRRLRRRPGAAAADDQAPTGLAGSTPDLLLDPERRQPGACWRSAGRSPTRSSSPTPGPAAASPATAACCTPN